MMSIRRLALRSLGLALGLVAVAPAARADAPVPPTKDTLLLNTACIAVKDSMKAAVGPTEMTGSGAFDANAASLTMPDGSQRIFVAYDDTGQWRKNSGIVPQYAVVDLKKDGLSIVKKGAWLGSAVFDKDRLFMKPVIAALPGDARSPGYFVLTGASEDNGTSGNPRTTILVYDANGNPIVDLVGTSSQGKTYGPRGERGIDVGAVAGRDNDQQQGASSVYYWGKDGDAHVLVVAFQENNRRAYVTMLRLTLGAQGATLTALSDAQLLQEEARHNRPTCAVAQGTSPSEFACATVHATQQPAEKGITVGRFDGKTGALLEAKDVAIPSASAETGVKTATIKDGLFEVPNGYRFAQSLLECADASCSSYVLSTSHVMKSKRVGNNGHTPGTHALDVVLLDRALAARGFTTAGNIAHAHLVPVRYGAGEGAPAAGLLSAPLTGNKPAVLQVLPLGVGEGRVDGATDANRYLVTHFSNVGDVVADGLNNPDNQGRGFLGAVANVANPGAGGGFMAGIRSFTAVPIPTFGAGGANFMGLDLCFVPATWDAAYKAAPGGVIPWNQAPVGPPPDPANPNASAVANPEGETGAAGVGARPAPSASSCAAAPASSRSGGGLALVGLAMAALGAATRRRRSA